MSRNSRPVSLSPVPDRLAAHSITCRSGLAWSLARCSASGPRRTTRLPLTTKGSRPRRLEVSDNRKDSSRQERVLVDLRVCDGPGLEEGICNLPNHTQLVIRQSHRCVHQPGDPWPFGRGPEEVAELLFRKASHPTLVDVNVDFLVVHDRPHEGDRELAKRSSERFDDLERHRYPTRLKAYHLPAVDSKPVRKLVLVPAVSSS
jgi:hypothetical protein